jgi:hypothetical protein
MKKIVKLFMISILSLGLFNIYSYAMPEILPADLGSNATLIEVLTPEERKHINYSETCLLSCTAEPGTEVTLFEKLTESLYIPMLLDDEAITAKVGESGILAFELTFKQNSENDIMFYAEREGKYQTILKKIIIESSTKKESVKHKAINIQQFINKYITSTNWLID